MRIDYLKKVILLLKVYTRPCRCQRTVNSIRQEYLAIVKMSVEFLSMSPSLVHVFREFSFVVFQGQIYMHSWDIVKCPYSIFKGVLHNWVPLFFV